ncbi:MAG: DUF501 domain-containing protein [Actinomycetota bacterium]|nr:DUF501 domain-containing protein [Actinomycetota bacterium]
MRDALLETDDAVLCAQLGRPAREPWEVVARCSHGRPSTILTGPLLGDGAPFPTLYWLTCPWLRAYVDGLESSGVVGEWRARLAAEPELAHQMDLAEAQYRERRAVAAGGVDPCAAVGIAGQRDSSATKCIHAHVAAALAGIDDPIGTEVIRMIDPMWCPDQLCIALLDPSAGRRA